jgi:hypothetical protein
MFKRIDEILEKQLTQNKTSSNHSKIKTSHSKPDGFYSKKHTQKQSHPWDFLQLIQEWSDIVGKELGKHTVPLQLKNQRLLILTDHSIYSQLVTNLQFEITDKIQKKFLNLQGKIKSFQFKISPQEFQDKIFHWNQNTNLKNLQTKSFSEIGNFRYSPEYEEMRNEAHDFLKESLNILEDEECKQLITSLYIQKISNKHKK